MEDFEVNDLENHLYDDIFEVDEFEVVEISQNSVLQATGSPWTLFLYNHSLYVTLGAFLLIIFIVGYVIMNPSRIISEKKQDERFPRESEVASRIQSVPIEEVEKVLFAGCMKIQQGRGSEIALLYMSQSRLSKTRR